MKKITAMKKFLATRELSTELLKPLGISFESFLRFAQLPKEQADQLIASLVVKYERALEAEKLRRKAAKALREGDIDAAFDTGIKAANVADGIE